MIRCFCGLPARQFTVQKEGPNKGRVFYKCSRPTEGLEPQCSFFQWADEQGDGGAVVPAKRTVSERSPVSFTLL